MDEYHNPFASDNEAHPANNPEFWKEMFEDPIFYEI